MKVLTWICIIVMVVCIFSIFSADTTIKAKIIASVVAIVALMLGIAFSTLDGSDNNNSNLDYIEDEDGTNRWYYNDDDHIQVVP